MKTKSIILTLIITNVLFFIHIVNINALKIKTNNNEYKVIEQKNNYKIQIYYPITNYKELDDIIENKIDSYISEFKSDIKKSTIPINQYYSLIILYDSYEYNNYLSYIFRIEDATGKVHPNHRIYTIVYDKKTNKVITLNDLIKKNKNILTIFSEKSRKELKTNKRIVDLSMLYEGTKPNKENFSNFVLSEDGLILFYPQYQVAPYSQGEFNVVISYKSIGKI